MTAKVHLDRAHLHELYRQMLRIRRFEANCVELYQAQKIRGFLHLYGRPSRRHERRRNVDSTHRGERMKAKTNGIETNYELHGKEGAPWLVLSHSLACSVRMWDPQIEALKGRYRILAYDTRGHGGSQASKGAYSLEMLADDLKALIDHLGVKNPHYCGLSMGGMIGQTFALKYPGVFRTLMLADTTSRYPAEAWPTWQERIKIAEEKGMAPLVQPTLERWFTEPFSKSNPAPVAAIGKLIASTPVAGYVGCCHAIPKINLSARLQEIKAPILVLCGEKDPGTPPAMAEEIHRNAPGSKLVMIANAAPSIIPCSLSVR